MKKHKEVTLEQRTKAVEYARVLLRMFDLKQISPDEFSAKTKVYRQAGYHDIWDLACRTYYTPEHKNAMMAQAPKHYCTRCKQDSPTRKNGWGETFCWVCRKQIIIGGSE